MSELDTVGMFEATAGLPEQIREAVRRAEAAEGLPPPGGISNILVVGMGGSGIVGDFLTVSAGPFISLPIVVVKNYEPPSYVSDKTLVLAVSHSRATPKRPSKLSPPLLLWAAGLWPSPLADS